MTDTSDALHRRKTQLIAALFGMHLVFGVLLVLLYPGLADQRNAQTAFESLNAGPLDLVHRIAILVPMFLWLAIDSQQLDIRRPWWLNIGIALLPWIFVPYYLYKTRPANHRGAAILGFFGILFACLMSAAVGMFLALTFGGVAPPTAAGV
jgi:hypothetical protein